MYSTTIYIKSFNQIVNKGRDHEQPEEAVEEAAVVQGVGGLAVLEAAAEGAAAA